MIISFKLLQISYQLVYFSIYNLMQLPMQNPYPCSLDVL